MSLKQDKLEWELPHLKELHRFPELGGDFWSAKFYPYTAPGVDPVFAAVGGKHILVCRLPSAGNGSKPFEVIQSIVDEEIGGDNFSCAWSKDLSTGTPLLCVAGEVGKILVINVLTGELHTTLAGHGGPINDLAVSPVNPQVLASASDDLTVRIWSLDPARKKEPCVAILAGDGHRETVLSISFHATGRYILSGGIGHMINLWALPEFPDPNTIIGTGTGKVIRIHYPHFSTSEIHMRHVDCVTFYNDLILSKCDDENCIVLWAISGFDSSNPVPPPLSAPTTHDATRDTRSAFTSANVSPDTLQYTRLLEFSVPDSVIMFMRFSLYPGSATTNPVLAMCNSASKVFFWDLARLEESYNFLTSLSAAGAEPAKEVKKPSFLIPYKHRNRGGHTNVLHRLARDTSPTDSISTDSVSVTNSSSNRSVSNPQNKVEPVLNTAPGVKKVTVPGLTPADSAKSLEIWAKRYSIGDPHGDIVAHKDEVVKNYEFVGRYVAWSNGGEWCVVVGSAGVIAVFERWQK